MRTQVIRMARRQRGKPIWWAGSLLVVMAACATGRTAERTQTAVARRPASANVATETKVSSTATMTMEVTAYCQCKECCGRNARGITASGQKVSYHNRAFVAADTSLLPFYSRLIIPGYNRDRPVPVIDTGSAINGRRIDVFFPSHAQAERWGRQTLTVKIVSVADKE